MATVQPAFDPAELPVYWREADARRVLDAWRATGSSMAAFARASGLPVERIRRWRRRLEGAEEHHGLVQHSHTAYDGFHSARL